MFLYFITELVKVGFSVSRQHSCWTALFTRLYSLLSPRHFACLCCSIVNRMSSVIHCCFFFYRCSLSLITDSCDWINLSFDIFPQGIWVNCMHALDIYPSNHLLQFSNGEKSSCFLLWPFQTDSQSYSCHQQLMIWSHISSWICFGYNDRWFSSFLD